MSGFRSIVAFLRRLLRSTARSTSAALAAGSISSTSSISDFSRNPWSSSTSPSSSSTSAKAVATSAYVSTPVCWPLAMRSLTSSSSCNSATDIHSPSSRRDERQGARPIQTDVRKSKASVCVVKRRTADFPLTCQSTNSFLPIIGAKGYLPARNRLDGGRGELYPAPGRLDWPAMDDGGGDV